MSRAAALSAGLRWLSAALVVSCAGCPAAPPPPPPARRPAAPAARPVRAPASELPLTRVTVERPPLPGPGQPFRLARGRVWSLGAGLRLGCSAGGEEGSPPLLRLEVLHGAASFSVPARAGASLPVGAGRLRVDRVQAAPPAVELSWSRPLAGPGPGPGPGQQESLELRPRRRADGALVMREMAFTRLDDGWLLAAGDVTAEGVTINLYPPDYEQRTSQGYDRFFQVGQGAVLAGRAHRFELASLRAADPDADPDARRCGEVALRAAAR